MIYVWLVELRPILASTGAEQVLRYSSSPRWTRANGVDWKPTLDSPLSRREQFFDGAFQIQPADFGTLQIALSKGDAPLLLTGMIWDGRSVKIWRGLEGQDTASMTLKFDGTSEKIGGDRSKISIVIKGPQISAPILKSTFAGTGLGEGGSDLIGVLKPLTLGTATNVEPIYINRSLGIFQYHAYSAAGGVMAVYDSGSQLGTTVGDYASYATLAAATIPAGRFATCNALGMGRHGGEITGVLTCDAVGAVSSGLPGAIIKWVLRTHLGISAAQVKEDSLDWLDSQIPYPHDFYLDSQTSAEEFCLSLMLSLGGYTHFTPDGKFTVGLIRRTGSPTVTLNKQNIAEGLTFQETSPPVFARRLGYARSWRVHSYSEVRVPREPNPRGTWSTSPSPVYQYYDLAEWENATWVYIASVAGNAAEPSTDAAVWVMYSQNGAAVVSSTTTPSDPVPGLLWYNPTNGQLKSYIGGVFVLTSDVTGVNQAATIAGQAATATSSDFAVVTGTTKPDNNATAADNKIRNGNLAVDASQYVVTLGTASRVASTTAGDLLAYFRATGAVNLIALNNGDKIPCGPGERLNYAFMARADVLNVAGGGANKRLMYVRQTFYNAASGAILTIDTHDATKAATNGESGGCGTTWQLHTCFYVAPANTASVKIEMFPLLGSTGAGKQVDFTQVSMTVAQAGADKTVDQLRISLISDKATSGTNLIRNGGLTTDAGGWLLNSVSWGGVGTVWSNAGGSGALRHTGATTSVVLPNCRPDRTQPVNVDDMAVVEAGRELFSSFEYASDGTCTAAIDFWFYNLAGTQIAGAIGGIQGNANTAGVRTRVSGKVTVPAGATRMFLRVVQAIGAGTYVDMTNFSTSHSDAGATVNTITSGVTFPASPLDGAVHTDTSVTPNVTKTRVGGVWVTAANLVTNTNQVTDGANLGGTSAWGGVSGRPAELTDGRIAAGFDASGDLNRNLTTARRNSSNLLGYATGGTYIGVLDADKFTGSASDTKLAGVAAGATVNIITTSASAPASPVNGDIWVDTSASPSVTKMRIGAAWVAGANLVTNTNQVTDGANLGGTAAWAGVSGAPANLAALDSAASTKLGTVESGADVTSFIVGPAEINVGYDYAGVVKTDELPKGTQFKLFKGGVEVTSGITWTVSTISGTATSTVSGSGSCAHSVTVLGSLEAKVRLVATLAGVARQHDVVIKKVLDNAPVGSTGGSGNPGTSASTTVIGSSSSTSYGAANTGIITVKAGTAGQVALTAPLAPRRTNAGSMATAGKWQWRAVGGSFADVTTEIASTEDAVTETESGVTIRMSGTLSVAMIKTGLTSGNDYEFQLLLRCTTASSATTFSGTAAATGT